MPQSALTVVKIGGELLETTPDLSAMVKHIAAVSHEAPVVVVHGGGRELSAELARRGTAPVLVDGVRITDEHTLAVAVSVLGGTINTRLVAACVAAGIRAVGLTGVDGAVLLARRSTSHRSRTGELVDLGHVGEPVTSAAPRLLQHLCEQGWVPIVASLGITAQGAVLNVNADVAASHVAVALGARRLLILGATDGVFDAEGLTIDRLSHHAAEELIEVGTAGDGMAAKLLACTRASACGVAEIRILNGRAVGLTGGTLFVHGEVARA